MRDYRASNPGDTLPSASPAAAPESQMRVGDTRPFNLPYIKVSLPGLAEAQAGRRSQALGPTERRCSTPSAANNDLSIISLYKLRQA